MIPPIWQQLTRKYGLGSSVGIATGYGLDGPAIESRWQRDFPHLPRPALGPAQPPVQWVPASFPGVKSGRGVTLTPHPLLVPLVMKSRAIPLHPLWAVQPVQSLSACKRVTFTFTFILLGIGAIITVLTIIQWWRDVTREETYQGLHTKIVTKDLQWGIILLIVSESILFVSFFWAFFHTRLLTYLLHGAQSFLRS